MGHFTLGESVLAEAALLFRARNVHFQRIAQISATSQGISALVQLCDSHGSAERRAQRKCRVIIS